MKIHNFDRENYLTFTFVAGEEIDTDTSQNYKIKRDRQEMVEMKQQIKKAIELLTMRRQALISSEIPSFVERVTSWRALLDDVVSRGDGWPILMK